MIKKILGLVAVIVLSGCAVNYTYEGQKYDSKEKLHQAVDGHVFRTVATITPLPKPLTQKKLIFAIPSEATLFEESKKRYAKSQGTTLSGPAFEVLENLTKSNYKNIKVFFDAVQKRNLYASVQLVELQSMNGSLAASTNTDALYLVEPSQGSSQWYYTSLKQDKQIFAYDRSSPTAEGKVQAFVDALQVQAIRE
jgi:hypothetical protein